MLGGIFGGDDGEDTPDDEPEQAARDDPEQYALTGEEYDVEPTGETVREGGRITKVETESEGVVAGPHVRRIIEGGYDDPKRDVPIGYQEDMQEGFVAAELPFDEQFRHTWLAGITGAGKSTEMEAQMLMDAFAGYGFVYFDPKGQDSRELLRKLPEHRLDDVIWFEPGSAEFDRTVGLNPLDVPSVDGETTTDADLEKAIENRLETLKASFAAKGELYSTMEAITESMGRAMMRSNADPDRPNYSVIDFYFILLADRRRENFAEECADPYVREFLTEIAEMDDEKVRPTLKRVKPWTENGVIRRIVARRESTIDMDEAVENDRIIIVRNPTESEDIRRLTTLSVWNELNSAIKRRFDNGNEKPYYLYGDEFDSIVTPQLSVGPMFARNRARKFGMTVAVQYPSQLDKDVRKPLQNNAVNSVFMKANDGDDAAILMDRFRGHDADDLIETQDYHFWTELGGNDAVKLKTWPPYPPLRGEDVIDEIIEDSLERYGADPLTDADIQRELPYGDMGEATDDFEVTDDVERVACKAVYDRALRVDAADGFVPLSDVAPAVRRTVAAEANLEDEQADELLGTDGKVFRRVVQHIGDDLLELHEGADVDGPEVRATDDAAARILAVGESESGGGASHYLLLRAAYESLTRRGAAVSIPEQGGGSLPDARVAPGPDADDVVEQLTGGDSAPIEAEKSTGDTKPGQTVLNLAAAANDDRRCLLVARPDDAERVWSTLVSDPPSEREYDPESEETWLYNDTAKVRVGGEKVYREGSRESRWFRDETTGEYVLRDDTGAEHARFEDAADVFADADTYAAVGRDGDRDDDLRTVRAPVIPEHEFDRELPTGDADEWSLLVADAESDDLRIYRGPDVDTDPLDALTAEQDGVIDDDADELREMLG